MKVDEIRQLIFKNIFGLANGQEKARLDAWLGESEENRQLYDRLRSAPFLHRAIGDDNRKALDDVWERIEIRTRTTRKRSLARRALRIAAVITLPIVAAIAALTVRPAAEPATIALADIHPGSPKVIVTLPNGDEMKFDENDRMLVLDDGSAHLINESNVLTLTADEYTVSPEDYTTYKIPSGGEYTIKLEDGTIVTMNSESELRAPVRFGSGERTVYFKGEGYFEVAKDPQRRFRVKTDMADIAVLGTEFNIRAYVDEPQTVTTLVEGSVNLISGAETSITMVPGTQARVQANGDVAVNAVDVYPYTAWRSGRIVFNNERMQDIMRTLRRWYNCEVYYADEGVKERRITMDILKYDDISEILELFRKINIDCQVRGNGIYLSSK